MNVPVHFHSYFKDLAGCADCTEMAEAGSPLGELTEKIFARFPRLGPARRCALIAVQVEYQPPDYQLQPGDEVHLFPPVQGG